MKLVMTLLVRDEEELLDANIRYHLSQGVDFIVATDNNSVDSTPEILERYSRAGVLHVIHEPGDDNAQSEWVTRMAQVAATDFGADWVINNDADEFWWPRVGTLKDVFEAVPEDYGAVVVPRFNFVPSREESGPFYERSVVVELESVKPRGGKRLKVAPMPTKSAHRARADVNVSNGSHRVVGQGLEPVPGWEPIIIFHYQVRSYEQFERRARRGETIRNPKQWTRHLLKLQRKGSLRDFYYEHKALSDEAIQSGIRDGRLCVDRRIQSFMRRIDDGAPGEATATAEDPAADGLQLDLARAVLEARRGERGEDAVRP